MKLPALRVVVLFVSLVLLPVYSSGQEARLPAAMPPATAESTHQVPGLELPVDQIVAADEGFVVIEARSKGPVQFLVIGSAAKVKFVQSGNTIVVSVPPPGGNVAVYAVAMIDVDGKSALTEFARTVITTKGSLPPVPPTPPTPPVPPVPPDVKPIAGKLSVAIIEDPTTRTPELAALINSASVRQLLASGQHTIRVFDVKDQSLNTNGLNQVMQRLGVTAPVVIVADAGGVIRHHQKLPIPEADLLATLRKLMGQ